MLQAVSIAGGRYRVNDPSLLMTTAGNLKVYRLQYNQQLARRARLQAELDDANTITFPPELLRVQSDPNVAQLIQREQSLFNARREAMASQMDALNQLKSLLNGEIASLQDKIKNMDQELALMRQELTNTTAMVQRGLAIAPREYQLRETELETEGRRLDLDTASLRAKEDIGKADQSIVELRNKTRAQVQDELADVEQKLPETAARISSSTMIVDREQNTGANADAATDDQGSGSGVTCVIVRRKDGTTRRVDADEAALIEPGDTVNVLRAGEKAPGSGLASGLSALPAPDLVSGLAPGQAGLLVPGPAVASRPVGRSSNAVRSMTNNPR